MKLRLEILEFIESKGIHTMKLGGSHGQTLTHHFSYLYLKHEILKAVTETEPYFMKLQTHPQRLSNH
jgi:hypothetical protein